MTNPPGMRPHTVSGQRNLNIKTLDILLFLHGVHEGFTASQKVPHKVTEGTV
jgi:hypothetical protein